MLELQNICIKAVDLCLPFIITEIDIINAGKATHLLGDFRADMNEWKTLISFNNNNINFVPEEAYKDKKNLFIILLFNDGVIEGNMYLLPTVDGKLNYALRVTPPNGINTDKFKDISSFFDKAKMKKQP